MPFVVTCEYDACGVVFEGDMADLSPYRDLERHYRDVHGLDVEVNDLEMIDYPVDYDDENFKE